MSGFKKCFALLLAVIWLPITAHCSLEVIPGLEFLHCAAPSNTADGENHCQDTCCSVESGHYRSAEQQDLLVPLTILSPVEPACEIRAQTLPPEVSVGVLTAAPPHFPVSWQFLARAALSPRAPSSVS